MKRLMLFVAVMMVVGGCAPLTQEQKARLATYKTDVENAATIVEDAKVDIADTTARIKELDAKLDALVDAIKAKQVPIVAGKALYDDLMANKADDRELLERIESRYHEAATVVTDGQANIKAMLAEAEEQGNKGRLIWEMIVSTALALVTGGSIKIARTEKAKKESCITGIEKAKTVLNKLLAKNGVDEAVINEIAEKHVLTKPIMDEAILSGVESSLHKDVRSLT